MPNFSYSGRSSQGELIDGEIEGANNSAVASLLMDRGITPITIEEKKPPVDIIHVINEKFDLYKISIEELLMFTRQMGALIRAGIPITRAIAGILDSIENPLLIKALRDIQEQLESGRSLSILREAPEGIFQSLYQHDPGRRKYRPPRRNLCADGRVHRPKSANYP